MRARNLLTLDGMTRDDLREILDLARDFGTGALDRPLAGKTICLSFFEASTLTSASFELAA